MADTLTNPYLQMGIMNMMKPNPYLNPKYQGQPLPMPGYYTGDAGSMGPTDAMGNIIPSFTKANNAAQSNYQQQLAAFNAGQGGGGAPGTTLNSTPGQGSGGQVPGGTINYAGMGSAGPAVQELLSNYQNAQSQLSPQQQYNQSQANAVRNQMLQQQDNITATANAGGGFGRSPGGAFNPGPSSSINPFQGAGAAGPSAPSGPSPPTPPDLRQAYLDALAAPQGIGNNLPTPGAQGAQSPPPQLGQPSVLDSFLANNSAGGKAVAGNYSNAPFFNTLNRLNSGSGGAMAQSQGPSLGMPSMAGPSMGMPSAGMPTNRNLIGVG